jgi:antitoxin ParD1/3/4
VAEEAGASLVAGPSIKAALDLDWDDATAQQHALTRILDALSAVEHWLDGGGIPMETINIPLPALLKRFVDEQVATGDYSSVSEYVRVLVRQDQKRKAQEQLKAFLLEAVDSDEAIDMTQDDWNLWP